MAGGGVRLTYGELEARANRLARYLKSFQVGLETRVAVCLERSPELVTAVLAVLKTGGAYLPLDPSHPPERLAFTLADARPAALLTSRRLRARLAGAGDVPVLALDGRELAARLAGESSSPPPPHPEAPDALAYVIYTSGSTGLPKGTELTHRGLLNLIDWHLADFALTPSDRATLVASPAFDASVWEVWPALAAGASLHVPPEELRSAPGDLLAWLAAERITVCFLPTPLAEACLAELEEGGVPAGLALRVLLTGGDRLRRVPRPGLHFRLVNCYGPTESTVVATAGTVPPWDGPPEAAAPPPAIGRPIAGLEAWVLDAHLRPVPAGVPGELLVGGLGLARGYLARPDLTAERFVPHPLALAAGARLYRTGDLVRWRADGAGGGELEFLGRSDDQVKVRGVRIEPGEIEAALAAHPAVRDAVVAARPSPSGENRLVAYLVPTSGGAAAELGSARDELRQHLAATLPEVMVPSAFVVLDALPLSPTGKVDRRALPEPVWEPAARAGGAPQGLAEELLAAIWGPVLGIEGVRREDSFFALGGHSLLATQVMSRVRSAFGVELPLRTLFERPTLAELAGAVEEGLRADAAPPPPLLPQPDAGDPPLSFAQERLWFLDQFGGDGSVYIVPEAWRLDGPLEPAALGAALAALVRRHETLRTTFEPTAHGVRPVVGAPGHVPLALADLSALPQELGAAEAARLASAEARRPFDLAAGPLLRAVLLRLAPARHDLLLALHHIATDGWSQVLLHRELAALYAAARERRPHGLAPLAVQYRDFARWQRAWLQGEALAAQLDFWRAAFAGAPAVLALPADRPRPAVQTFRGADARIDLPAALVAELEALSRRQGVTLFMTLLASFDAFLARHAEREDVVVGTPIANRNREEIEGLVGFFVNTLPLRARLGDDPPFGELLARVRDGALAAYAHQDLPFEKLVEELAPRRDLAHPPLFQVLFALHQFDAGAADAGPALPGLAVRRLPVEQRIAKFDLALHVEPEAGGAEMAALARYNSDLFDDTTVRRLLEHFRNLLAAAAAGAEAPVSELPMLAPAEVRQLLWEWNDTDAPFPAGLCLHEPFEAQARARPDAPAIVSPRGSLTYGELDAAAARLARRLAAAGVGPGDLVGIHLERSPAMAVAVFGALKAGAAYVPLETGWPVERVRWILAAHGIAHLVTETAHRPALGAAGLEVICLDEPAEAEAGAGGPPPRRAGPEDLAYIIFTSGSTGTPKGVMVRHAAAVNLIHWVNRRFAVGPADRLLFVTALSFDLSVYDLFGVLAAGGTVRLATDEEVHDPQRLVGILREEGITFWDSAPASLQACAGYFGEEGSGRAQPTSSFDRSIDFDTPHLASPRCTGGGSPLSGEPLALSGEPSSSLRLVFNSGDWIPVGLPDRVRAAFPRAEFVSLGGATEATVWSNYYPVAGVDPAWPSIPYGRPIANARYHVLDPRLSPCPIGVPGDLFIGGPCLSLGYAGDPAQTAASYLPSPWGPEPGARLYQTGDRARWLADGNLEFLGRRDTQVKVRGFRIELGEIETVLAAHPGVREAVVVAREDGGEPARGEAGALRDQRLVAYFIPAGDPAPDGAALRRHLQAKLPDYMLPAACVPLASWPLSASGKLDRKALPSPFAGPAPRSLEPAAAPTATAPRGAVAQRLAALWREVIGVEEVGLEDNFFELGGHSLLLARVHARLPDLFGRSLPMVDLFKYPTVGALAAHLAAGDGDGAAAEGPRERARPRTVPDTDQRIAVVGMAGRFPGANDPGELWANLRGGVESVRFFADEELLAAGVPAAQLADPRYVKARGVLGGTDLFDAPFFDVTPREAQALDPQQRLFLECAWQALEDAGRAGDAAGLQVGVYAGASENGYLHLLLGSAEVLRAVGRYGASLANNPDYLATRVSYKLDLQGPSLAVQTACSTALVAVHLACRSLLAGDCDLALAGGVSVRVPEVEGYPYEEGGIASPDGHTRPFDAAAAGTVRSSGVGVVALRRLADALADGDAVRAVILGSAINNDGAGKVGFTAPGVGGQARVIREAHRSAGVAPETIGCVEAHGTATALGDPIEVAALTEAFRHGTELSGFCALGSIKSNIGHTDAAAGVAGLLKTVLALQHGEIPPSLNFRRPNPKLALEGSPFYVPTRLVPWEPAAGAPRRAGVSSFGIGGTNAHLVLEEAPPASPGPRPSRPAQLLLLSAKSPAALDEAAARLAAR
ncbi:MAG TPA: amino acid adenylation domain-containing protein, partial [Thermoanaerobaculia bacterium]|nr:amino acid adenylation domain-containing protein [Thermoanaerobaculia bacterium]